MMLTSPLFVQLPHHFARKCRPVNSIGSSCLAMALMFGFAPISNADALINGEVVKGAISTAGDLETYTFSAKEGEHFDLRIVDTGKGAFHPLIALYGPTGVYIDSGHGYDVGAISYHAKANGVYRIVVSDGTSDKSQVGGYLIHFALVPGANEGGVLVNGEARLGAIDLGDIDSYTFSANIGETVNLRIADTGKNNFYPLIALYGPTGTYIDSGHGYDVGAIAYTVKTKGVHTVLVSDGTSDKSQSGNYKLSLLKIGGESGEPESVQPIVAPDPLSEPIRAQEVAPKEAMMQPVWNGGTWQTVDYDGCDDFDLKQHPSPEPLSEFCDQDMAGKVAVCQLNGCVYKNATPKQCRNGSRPGRMYVCAPN